ncbi:MAG: TIGR03905 family TSCPD domain-containing protein [Clostridium sp.]|nr:TIGR03905 family TSCPD domain-containing protein [Clostridium sp.]
MFKFKPEGTCSKEIEFDIENNKIINLSFKGGCPGNLLGISHLVEGMDIDEVIKRLRGIDCGGKGTSCPDQLSRALESYKQSK